MGHRRIGFTLTEVLVVVAIIAILAAVLLPVFARAKAAAQSSVCLQQTKQVGTAFLLYLGDSDGLLPDRRDLKTSLPGGFRPWTGWPPSDPRAGWAKIVLEPYAKSGQVWACPSSVHLFKGVVQVEQAGADMWLWRFDRFEDPVPLDNFWGKSEDQAVNDLKASGNPQAGDPQGVADVELMVDVYFPKTIGSVPEELKGKSPHFAGRNRLFLDLHARFQRDHRLDP